MSYLSGPLAVVDYEETTGIVLHPEPRGPWVLPVGELVLWYGMFAPCGRRLGTTGFVLGAPLSDVHKAHIG